MSAPPTLTFPPPIEEIFQKLWEEIAAAHANWLTFRQLFGTDEAREVINGTAPGVFSLVRYALISSMVMNISRVTDPMTTGRGRNPRENLTLDRLVCVIRDHCPDHTYADRLHGMAEAIRTRTENIRAARNQSFGHLDLQTCLGTRPFPQISDADFQESLDLLAEFMNDVNIYFTDTTTPFDHPVMMGTGTDLIYFLREYLKAQP